MTFFQKAVKKTVKIKLALTGVSGAGKTFSALRLARGLVGPKGRIAFIDTENGSASLYSDITEFDVIELSPPFLWKDFLAAIDAAEKENYDVLIVDSASHLWLGILEIKEKLDSTGSNSFVNWGKMGPCYQQVIFKLLQSKLHVIICLRSKTDYVIEESENAKGQKVKVPRKVGLEPVFRQGSEYEFSTVLTIGETHLAVASKDRTGLFNEIPQILTEETGQLLADWINGKIIKKTDNQEKELEVKNKKNNTKIDNEIDDYCRKSLDEAISVLKPQLAKKIRDWIERNYGPWDTLTKEYITEIMDVCFPEKQKNN